MFSLAIWVGVKAVNTSGILLPELFTKGENKGILVIWYVFMPACMQNDHRRHSKTTLWIDLSVCYFTPGVIIICILAEGVSNISQSVFLLQKWKGIWTESEWMIDWLRVHVKERKSGSEWESGWGIKWIHGCQMEKKSLQKYLIFRFI